MACYPMAFLVMSAISGLIVTRVGKKNFMVIGMLLITIATGTFGLAASVGKSATLFFAISIVARFIQGLADGMLTVTLAAIIVMEYPTKQELYLGYWNMSIGVGTCIGPIIGSILSYYLTYGQVFGVFAVLEGLALIITASLLPNRLNHSKPRRTSSTEHIIKQNTTYV